MVLEGRGDVIPLYSRQVCPPTGPRMNVTSREVGYKSIPSGSIYIAPVQEGQQGAVSSCLPSHPDAVVAVQPMAQRGGEVSEELEESWKVIQPGRGVIVRRPPIFELRHGEPGALLLWGKLTDSGCISPPCPYLRGPEYVGGFKHNLGSQGRPEEQGHVRQPPRMGFGGRPQPF